MCENDISDFDMSKMQKNDEIDNKLAVQDFSKLDLDKLSPTTFEVMSRQATVNVGTIGHVAHGKSTVVKALSGVKTQKFIREAIMNITIHLGYANAKVFKCGTCPSPACYHTFSSSQADKTPCPQCGNMLTLERHFSFVDCPGHDVLMATMLNGAAIMDAALLLIAANETFPQPQTLEHLKAVEIMRLRNILVLQNKIDLVQEVTARDQYQLIRAYMDNTIGVSSPVIPISAQLGYNIDLLLEYLCHIPMPTRRIKCPVRMTIVRSFDVNKPSDDVNSLCGGVAGGSVQQGVLRVNTVLQVLPGVIVKRHDDHFTCTPIHTRIVSLMAEQNNLEYAIPGGLIAVGTNLDPSLTRQNKLVGQMLGEPGSMPSVYHEIEVQFHLLNQLLGAKKKSVDDRRVMRLALDEALQINVGTLTAGATVTAVSCKPDMVKLALQQPVCCSEGEQIAISRRVDRVYRLIGWGSIRRGTTITLNKSL